MGSADAGPGVGATDDGDRVAAGERVAVAVADPVAVAVAFADPVAVAVAFADPVPVAVVGGSAVLAVPDGCELEHGAAVALAVFLAVALAVAEAVAVAEVVLLAGAVLPVALALADGLPAAPPLVVLPVAGLVVVLPVAGLVVVLPVAGLVVVVLPVAGVTLGDGRLDGVFDGDGEGLDGHAVGVALFRPVAVPPWVSPPGEEAIGLPVPAAVPAPPVLCGASPVAVPSWTKASRSGGTARATPMANTAQAMARAGRSSPSRQSRGCRRA